MPMALIATREHFSGANPIRVQNRNQIFGDLRGGLLSCFMVSELGPGPQSWASGFTTYTPITNNTSGIPTARRNRVGGWENSSGLRAAAGAAARGASCEEDAGARWPEGGDVGQRG